jgi:PDZ domain-containing secreted protein
LARAKERALTTIQGNALNSTNGRLNGVLVRLRDARFGRIVDAQLTDQSGLFAFKSVDPGSYIVEIMASDQSILAASQLLSVNAGEAATAVVKLPFRLPTFGGIMGSTMTATAAAVATAAAMGTVAAVVPTTPISPDK